MHVTEAPSKTSEGLNDIVKSWAALLVGKILKVVADAGNLPLQAALHTNNMLHVIPLFHSLFASKPATEPAFAINH